MSLNVNFSQSDTEINATFSNLQRVGNSGAIKATDLDGTTVYVGNDNKVHSKQYDDTEVKADIEGLESQISQIPTSAITKSEFENAVINGKLLFPLVWETGNISATTGANQTSSAWDRTVDFYACEYDGLILHVDRINGHNRADLRIFVYDGSKTFINSWKIMATYADNSADIELTKGYYYKFANAKYSTFTPSTMWDFFVKTPLSELIENKSETVIKTESVSASEFNARNENDNVMNNNVQYNIYGNKYVPFHNGKMGKTYDTDYICKFVLLSDAHIGGSYYNDTKKAQYVALCKFINSLGADFAIELGDNVDDGYKLTSATTKSQIAEHKRVYSYLNIPLYSFGGNHDTGVPAYSRYGTIDFGDLRLIKFHADYSGMAIPSGRTETVWSSAVIPQEQLDYVQNQLQKSKAKVNIVCSHYALAIDETYATFKWWIRDTFQNASGATLDGKRDDILQILADNNVKFYINGHEHTSTLNTFGEIQFDGKTIIDYNSPTVQTHYSVITVKETEIIVDTYALADNSKVATHTVTLSD